MNLGEVLMRSDDKASALNKMREAGGVAADKIFDFVKELRKEVCVPIAFMTYANVVFSCGTLLRKMRRRRNKRNNPAGFAVCGKRRIRARLLKVRQRRVLLRGRIR